MPRPLNPEVAFKFLERKVHLMSEYAEPILREELRFEFRAAHQFMLQGTAYPLRAWREVEREYESMIRDSLTPVDWDHVNSVLMAEFGFARLGSDPEAVVRRVLKRGGIKDEDEWRWIREIVTNVENESQLGLETYCKLAEILENFENRELKKGE